MTALIPKVKIDRLSLLFISRSITIQRAKFSHGYSLNNNRMKAQKIILPLDEEKRPNWSYMKHFMMNIERQKIECILKYLD